MINNTLASFQFAPTFEVAALLDRHLEWKCQLLDIALHNRSVAKMIPKICLWSKCSQVAAIQTWPPIQNCKRRARARGVGARGGRVARGGGRARGRGRGRARHGAHAVPAAAAINGDVTPNAEAEGMPTDIDDDDADDGGESLESVSDECIEDGLEESEMAEALIVLGKMIEEAYSNGSPLK